MNKFLIIIMLFGWVIIHREVIVDRALFDSATKYVYIIENDLFGDLKERKEIKSRQCGFFVGDKIQFKVGGIMDGWPSEEGYVISLDRSKQ